MWRYVTAVAILAACGSSGDTEENSADEPEMVAFGVYPDQFQCDSVAPLEELQAIVGPDVQEANPASTPPPRGVARPCNYMRAVPASEFDGDAGPDEVRYLSWSFDLDCREGAMREVESLRAEYSAKDAGVVEVDVGRSGTDHRDAQLVFVDGDAPCYVRVRGPGADSRLALARLIEKNLTDRNAPRNPPEYRRAAK